MVLLGKLCGFGSFREVVGVWFSQGDCADLDSLGEVVLIWFSQGSCADLGSLREAVQVWVLSRKLVVIY